MGQLFIWSAVRGEWVSCPPDEITWLDRGLLSDNEDLTLHRAPRCGPVRGNLSRRAPPSRVSAAPRPDGRTPASAEAVQRVARHVLPAAPVQYEALPVVLEEGAWVVSVGAWVLPLRLDMPAAPRTHPGASGSDKQPPTRDSKVMAKARRGSPPREDAVARVRGYFERNATARMAMAYYYQEFILGLAAPQTVPMTDVVIALDLSGEGAVSDYKKLLQGFIWEERGHARDLADFLLSNGLLTPFDLDQARQTATANERNGVCETARRRLQYRPKEM